MLCNLVCSYTNRFMGISIAFYSVLFIVIPYPSCFKLCVMHINCTSLFSVHSALMYPLVTSVGYYEKLVENEFLLNSSKMVNFIYIDGFP